MRKIVRIKDLRRFPAKDLFAVLYKDVIYFGIFYEKNNVKMVYLPTEDSEILAENLTKFSLSKDGDFPECIYYCDDVYIDDILIEMEKNSILNVVEIRAVEKDVNHQRYVYQLNKIKTDKLLAEQRRKISAARKAYEFKMEKQ